MDDDVNTITDQVFESGHCDCVSGQVNLTTCADGARMLVILLNNDAQKWDLLDPDIAYYMRSFAADIEVQVSRQTEDLDTVPADWS